MSELEEKVYKELIKGPKPNLSKNVALEEEDYIPSQPDPDKWIETVEFNEDDKNEDI